MSKMPERVWASKPSGHGIYDALDYNENGYPQEYIRADIVPKWIPVSERLPEENDACLVALDVSVFGNKCKAIDMGYINKGVWHDAHSEAPFAEINPVTHWQELPQLPSSD